MRSLILTTPIDGENGIETVHLSSSSTPALQQTELHRTFEAVQAGFFDDLFGEKANSYRSRLSRICNNDNEPLITNEELQLVGINNPSIKMGLYHVSKLLKSNSSVSALECGDMYWKKRRECVETIATIITKLPRGKLCQFTVPPLLDDISDILLKSMQRHAQDLIRHYLPVVSFPCPMKKYTEVMVLL